MNSSILSAFVLIARPRTQPPGAESDTFMLIRQPKCKRPRVRVKSAIIGHFQGEPPNEDHRQPACSRPDNLDIQQAIQQRLTTVLATVRNQPDRLASARIL